MCHNSSAWDWHNHSVSPFRRPYPAALKPDLARISLGRYGAHSWPCKGLTLGILLIPNDPGVCPAPDGTPNIAGAPRQGPDADDRIFLGQILRMEQQTRNFFCNFPLWIR